MTPRILLLEDDNFCLGLLETVLISEGYDVLLCDSPSEVVRQSRSDPMALALVDFWGGSQLALTDEDRAQLMQMTAVVPTILVTARSWAATCDPGELDLMAIVVKPFGLAELYDNVTRCAVLLSQRVSAREHAAVPGL